MKLSFFSSLCFPIFLAACQTTPSPGNDLAIRFFNDIAFQGSPGGYPLQGTAMLETNYSGHRMYRWHDEIRVGLSGAVKPEHRKLVEKTLKRMTEITGHQTRMLSSENEAPNFTVEFVEKENFNIRKTEAVPCYAHYKGGEDNHIGGIDIKISVENPKLAIHCIAHELFHGFGFAHSDLVRSIISNKTRENIFTRWDELALQTMYDPRLKSGMTRMEAMPIARRIILELLGKSKKTSALHNTRDKNQLVTQGKELS